MSDDEEPYEQEFDSEGEQDYFAPVKKPTMRATERPAAIIQTKVREEEEDEEDEYADEDFEEKSSEVLPDPPKAIPKAHTEARKREIVEDEEEEDGFFMTGVRQNSKDMSPARRVSGGDVRSNVQSSGKLTSVSHFDSPEKAMKYLSFLKKENISLRNDLKLINDRLNEILDQKIAEKPKRVPQPEAREKATNTQLETAQKQLDMIKKEKIKLYKRLQMVESPEYVEELKESVESKERKLQKLQKSQKRSRKTQQTREKDIEKEIFRSELSLNTRVLQELQMENEGLRAKIRELEREDERNAGVASELESQQEKLEQRYLKLMTVAKQNGAFEENSRENKRIHKLKQQYEEQKSTLISIQSSADTVIKQLKRQEAELKSELETSKLATKSQIEQMRDKQSRMTQYLEELQDLRPKVQGSGYESLLDRISTSIKEKEALIDKPITPLRLRSLETEKDALVRGKSATKVNSESRKSPLDIQTESRSVKPGKIEDSPMVNTKPPLVTSKPSLFSSGVSIGKEEEKPPVVPKTVTIEEKKEPEVVKKPPGILSKPSLFGAVKMEEPLKDYSKEGKEVGRETIDFIPTKEVRMSQNVGGDVAMSSPPVFDPKPKLTDFTPPTEPLKPIVSSNPPPTDEIGTLDTFPSRRRGKKPITDPLPSVLPSTTSVQSSPNPVPIATLQSASIPATSLQPSPQLPTVIPNTQPMNPAISQQFKDPFSEKLSPEGGSKPRNRSHLLGEDNPPISDLPIPSKPTVFDTSPSGIDPKVGRNRSHLIEDIPSKPVFVSKDSEESKQTRRDRSHLTESQPSDVPKTEFSLLEKRREEKKENRVAELAKKAEKGGFFGDVEEEDLDFTDLNKVVTKVQPLTINKSEAVQPIGKKAEIPKPQILDLEESDIML